MRVAILGLGAAGRGLAHALTRPGIECVVAARDPARAEALARLTGATPARTDPEAAAGADVVLFAVHEEALVQRAEAFAAACAFHEITSGVALHLAGALAPDALQSIGDVGWSIGRMHPLVALRPTTDGSQLRGAPFALAGDERALEAAERLVAALDGTTLRIAPGAEAAYHASAALVAQGAVALVAGAAEALAPLLVDTPDATRVARRALASLLASVAANLEAVDATAALTGPVARGSAETVELHLAALTGDAAEYYRGVLPRLVRLAAPRLTPAARERLERLVEDHAADRARDRP
ncbi:MAG: DUF2520 domain-containing protein [Planctomycetota bacterium]